MVQTPITFISVQRIKKHLLILLSCLLCTSAYCERTLTVTVTNPTDFARADVPIIISLNQYGTVCSALVTCSCNKGCCSDKALKEIPCQLDDLNQDDAFDELCFLANLDSKEEKCYTIVLSETGTPRPYPARVYAEMVMANTKDKTLKKNQQNNYIESVTARGDAAYTYNLQHHHGVDFESELNGIRIYFDARQTLDLYGKYHKQLELQKTQFYTDDEQKAQGYGDDVLWVGQTFGLGAFRGWDGKQPTLVEPVKTRCQRVVSYGPLRTIVEVIDRGWQLPSIDSQTSKTVTMTLRYTQYAGHRDTNVDVLFNQDVSDCLFSTGIINVKGSVEYSDKQGLRACWGTDYPSSDTVKWKRETVGLAVLVPKQNIASEEPANKDNYAYVLRIKGNTMSYKVSYTSANEDFGYHSAGSWFSYLQAWRKEVDTPVKITIK